MIPARDIFFLRLPGNWKNVYCHRIKFYKMKQNYYQGSTVSGIDAG